VPNYVSTFAGFDLPDSERYMQAKWQAWFDTHRDSINIKFNADAYKVWTNLSDSLRDVPDTAQVARYEAFLVRFPGYQRAKAELAGKLNGIAWNLATGQETQGRGDTGTRRRLALKYALRAVELSDDPNIWDTVIEAYLANGKKAEALRVCKEALAKHPDEQVLKDRLAQLQGR
jgi:tetratricopeptide (TPR) repeat protein